MKGLRRYSHHDREKVIQEMIPLIQDKFGSNLVALAACASFARNEDADYSDLELTAFIREFPGTKEIGGMGKIRDGLLVELVWMTKETYIKTVLDVTKDWYIAGSDVLLPLINESFFDELVYEVDNLRKKCLYQASCHWGEVQESTAKVLNAIKKENRLGIPLLLYDMCLHMLRVLSFLNQTPYKTFSEFISQSREFRTKPAHFDELTQIVVDGEYQDLVRLDNVITQVFCEFENIFGDMGVDLYDDNVDPRVEMKYVC